MIYDQTRRLKKGDFDVYYTESPSETTLLFRFQSNKSISVIRFDSQRLGKQFFEGLQLYLDNPSMKIQLENYFKKLGLKKELFNLKYAGFFVNTKKKKRGY